MSAVTEQKEPHVLSFTEIKNAAAIIEGGIIHTPLCEAKISKFMDYNIYLKCENLQYTGSCAERGVRNALLSYGAEGVERGVIVPSHANMALGSAYHGSALGVPVTVVMPELTPPAHAQRCSELGADVVLCGNTLADAVKYARKVQQETNRILLE